jgi:hypothetical protein
MRTVTAEVTVTGEPGEVERRWYDVEGWPDWFDGVEQVLGVSGDWPAEGAVVRWRSPPTGRGEVTESVIEHAPGEGQVCQVRDDTVEGLQSVSFGAGPDGVTVTLTLAYRVSRRSPLTPLLELLFVSRAFRASLETTLQRFAAHV